MSDVALIIYIRLSQVPTCCSCHVDSFRDMMTSSPPVTTNKYATIFEDDDSEEEEEGEEDDTETNSSIAYQYSNGFKKTPQVSMTTAAPMPMPKPTPNPSILTMKKIQSMMETVKNSKPPENMLNSYLKPPSNNEFDGDGSYKRRQRRPMRKHVRDQMATGSELHTDIRPSTITLIDFFDRPLKRRASTTILTTADKKISSTIPNISTAATSVYDLSKRVNYNYHPIIDFFSETVST